MSKANPIRLKHILSLAFLTRIILIPFFNDSYNFWASRVFTGFFVGGFNPWTIVYHDPTLYWINPWRYPPLFLVLTVPAQIIYAYAKSEIVFLYITKTPLVVADLITTFFLYKTALILSGDVKEARKLAMLYAFNPITILVSAIWGINDPISVMFTVVALYFFIRRTSTKEVATSAIFLGWGIAFKFYPIFILPAFLAKLKRLKEVIIFAIFASLPLTVSSIPFLMWDPQSYINMLLMHNLGDVYPLSMTLYLQKSQLAQTALFLFTMTLFVIAYLKKTFITVNITVCFFALYLLFGGLFPTNYFLWIVPFTILLLADKAIADLRGSQLLPFVTIPSIVHTLIFNGMYNQVEGVTGFFYWIYHWLRWKIIPYKILPILQSTLPIIALMNILIIIYFFYKLMKASPAVTLHKNSQFSSLTLFRAIKKNKNLVLSLLAILACSIFIFPQIVPCEPMQSMPKVAPSTFTFFDDFNSSTLNYQWALVGDTTYTLYSETKPSYIFLNASQTPHNGVSIYRGRSSSSLGFFNSDSVIIEIRSKFNGLATETEKATIAKTDGGWFGVTRENLTSFVYFDDDSNNFTYIKQLDDHWHTFKMESNTSGRFIFFDGVFKGYHNPKTFSILFLGKSCSVDWVKVVIQDFPSSSSNKIYALLAIGVPLTMLTLISVKLLHPKKLSLSYFRKYLHE
jgi:hypothetical protein